VLSGHGQEESEELLGRVISVMDSFEHFKDQAVLVLQEVREGERVVAWLGICGS